MDDPHRRVVTVRTSCSNQAVMSIVLSPLACHTMCWHLPPDDVGHPYTYRWFRHHSGFGDTAVSCIISDPVLQTGSVMKCRQCSGNGTKWVYCQQENNGVFFETCMQRRQTMALNRTLLQNGCVITVDRELGNFWRADVLIEGTKIAAIGPDLGVTDAEVIDASNMIVMPGFIDTHRHLWEGILRNISTDGILANYFPDVLGVLAPVYRPADAYAGDLIGTLGAIDTGVTTILDWSHIQNTPEHADAVIKALQESGTRAVFAYGNPNTSLADWWFNSSLKHPEDIRRLRTQYFSSEDQLITLALAPRGPEFTTPEVLKHDWDLAREVGARITVHVGVGDNGFSGGIKRMYEEGLLGPDTTYIHCSTLSDDELKYIVDTGGTFSISTAVEMQMRHGMPPLDRILRLGARPSLSVDVETNVSGDMFGQMRAAFQCQRALVNQRALYGGSFEGENL